MRDLDKIIGVLAALGYLTDDPLDPEPTADGRMLAVLYAETDLALFLLDERSIQSLLRSLNLLLTAARQEADHALGREDGGER